MSIPDIPPLKWIGYAVWTAANENGPKPPDPRLLERTRVHRIVKQVKETIIFKSRKPRHLWTVPPRKPPMTTIDRRALIAGGLAAIAAPALPAYYPLPGFLTPESLLETAANTRRRAMLTEPVYVMGIDRSAYLTEWLTRLADIFERMAGCREPFEDLEHEMYATERALQRKHNYTPP